MSRSNLLFILTGSIAAYKACDVISQLVQRGHRIRTVATPSALRFVGPATLEGLTGEPVRSDLYAAGEALDHIALTRWADAVVLCPATAHTLNQLAAGLAPDLTGALFLAHDRSKPFLIAPAMNPAMWAHPATVAAVEKLTGWGLRFIPVAAGRTACGEDGAGRLAEPALIVASVEAALARPARRLRILVTGGGTSEPVDGVRVLTNTSSGRTGALLAARFVLAGHKVLLLRARTAAPAPPLCREEVFSTFAELDAALTRILAAESFDLVLHAAAVGDFSVGTPVDHSAKLPSSAAIRLDLRPNPKLLPQLVTRSRNPAVIVVAFKLTRGADEPRARDAVRALLASGAHYVVHNDLAQRGAEPDDFPSTLHGPDGSALARCATRPELAAALADFFSSPNVSS